MKMNERAWDENIAGWISTRAGADLLYRLRPGRMRTALYHSVARCEYGNLLPGD
jgi:hypothetical protein